jgi:hypothetical protein
LRLFNEQIANYLLKLSVSKLGVMQMCTAGVHRHPIPIVGTVEVIDDHMRHGHKTDLIAAGLKPEHVKEILVPSIVIK